MKKLLFLIAVLCPLTSVFGEGSEALKLGTQTHNVQSPTTINWTGTTQNFTGATISGLPAAVANFTDLGDVPSTYGGQTLKLVRVNAGETGLEFVTPTGGGTVSSVAVTGANGISVSGSPITTTGTIALTLPITIAGTTGKTLTVSNSLTLAGTDASTLNIGGGGTLGSAAFTASTAYQTALGFTPENVANKDADGTLSANSDTKYASQKAAKTYSDTKLGLHATADNSVLFGGFSTGDFQKLSEKDQANGYAGVSAASKVTLLANLTNDTQTKSAVVPNTVPSAGQILAGNAGGTAYAPVTISGSGATATLSSGGVLTLSAIPNATLSSSAITIAGTSTSLGGSITQDTITGLSSTGLVKRTASNALGTTTDNSTNWDTAYTDRLKWDGGATGLVAATGRTSLALVPGTDVEAWDTQLDSLATLSYTGNSLKVVRVNSGETGFELATVSAGSGTVTATGGSLTSNAVVLGAGTTDTKVSTGIVTDGTAKLTLGVNTTTLGQLKLFGNTSGDATIQPPAVAGTSTVVTLPNTSSTLPIFGQQVTFSGPTAARTVTLPDANFTAARTDDANTFTGHQTIEGVTSTGATGTDQLVFSTAPTLSNPVVGTQAAGNNSTRAASTAYVDGNTTNHGGWTEVYVSGSNYTNGTTSLTDVLVTGTLSNSTEYEVEATVDSSSSSSAGIQFAWHGGGSGTAATCSMSGNGMQGTSNGAGQTSAWNAIDTQGQAVDSIGASLHGLWFFRGFITTRGSGTATISLQCLKVTSGTATVYIGSVLRYRVAGQ